MQYNKIPGLAPYLISETGIVKREAGVMVRSDGRVRFMKERILSFSYNKGYTYVALQVNHTSKHISVHRLVALTFIPNPENKATVNHINGIHDDNRVENLEWATTKENNLHSVEFLGNTYAKRSLKIICVNTDLEYKSITEAAANLSVTRRRISKVLNGIEPHIKGLKFKYV